MAARGELPPEDSPVTEAEPAEQRGGLLTRLFPPAPPLPDRPDPLVGFNRDGPLRPVREGVFLLRRNLLAWVVPGIVAFFGYFASQYYGGDNLLGLLGSFVMFGALIAAGWIGWQRPALFGTVAGVLSYLLVAGLAFFTFAQRGAGAETFGGIGPLLGSIAIGAVVQAGFGFVGGWYGGYLRRRQTQLNASSGRRRR